MSTHPDHRSAVLREVSEGGEVIYDDGEVALVGARPPTHVFYATGLVVLVVVFSTTLVGRILVGGPGGTTSAGPALAVLVLLCTGVGALLVLLAWSRAVTQARSEPRRVVHRHSDGRVRVVPLDVYDTVVEPEA